MERLVRKLLDRGRGITPRQHLHQCPAVVVQLRRVRFDRHAVLDRRRTGGDESRAIRQADQAGSTLSSRLQAIVVAESRDLDPDLSKDIQNRRTHLAPMRSAVDDDVHAHTSHHGGHIAHRGKSDSRGESGMVLATIGFPGHEYALGCRNTGSDGLQADG